MMRTYVAAVTVAVLLAGMTGCRDDDQPAAAAPKKAVAVVTQGPDTGDLLVHGTVRRDGKPVEDAEVWLSLWPEPDDTKIGETVDTFETDSVRTDDDGHYVLRLDPETLTSRYFPAGNDFLNFEIQLWADGELAEWNSTVSLIDNRVWRTDGARIGDPAYDLSFDLGKKSITTTDSTSEVATSDLSIMKIPEDAVVPQ